MELVLALLIAGPLGYFTPTARQALTRYLGLAVVVLPIQTLLVHLDSPADINPGYFALNAIFVAVGSGLNQVGHRLRQRRAVQA